MYGAWQDEQLVEEFEKMKSAGNEQTDQSETGEGQEAGEDSLWKKRKKDSRNSLRDHFPGSERIWKHITGDL